MAESRNLQAERQLTAADQWRPTAASVHERLLVRPAGLPYRRVLEDVLGLTLDRAVVTTSEHAAPFNLRSTVSFVLPQLAVQAASVVPPTTILVLAGALVPLDNAHHPRGFMVPTGTSAYITPPATFNVYPQRNRKDVAALLSPRPMHDLAGAGSFFSRYDWLKPAFERPDRFASYAEQLCACMERIAERWLAYPSRAVVVRPLEDIARQCLIRLLRGRDEAVHRVLFDRQANRGLLDELDGVLCAWGSGRGTSLFWRRQEGRLQRLDRWDQAPEIVHGPSALSDALERGLLWPGVLLSLLAVSYLPGVPVAGGPKQLTYYRAMISALNRATGLERPTELSVYAYMSIDLEPVRWAKASSATIPEYGAGLALAADPPTDPQWLLEELRAAPTTAPPAATARYQ